MGRGIIDLSGEPVSKALLLKMIGNSYILNMVTLYSSMSSYLPLD